MLNNLFKKIGILFQENDSKDKQTILRERILSEYKTSFHTYEEFSLVMKKLIENLLIESGYKYQLHVRVKDLIHLEEKIKRKQALGKNYNKLNDIEDLVGLRIIFYSELDKEKFVSDIKNEISGLIRLEEREKKNGYAATHIVTSFGRKRLKLVEYRPYAGLKCEIQITSAIHHAWAEVEHDLIYKDINGLEKIDPEKYKIAKNMLAEILEKHIVKASQEFEEVIQEIRTVVK